MQKLNEKDENERARKTTKGKSSQMTENERNRKNTNEMKENDELEPSIISRNTQDDQIISMSEDAKTDSTKEKTEKANSDSQVAK